MKFYSASVKLKRKAIRSYYVKNNTNSQKYIIFTKNNEYTRNANIIRSIYGWVAEYYLLNIQTNDNLENKIYESRDLLKEVWLLTKFTSKNDPNDNKEGFAKKFY
jgi:hypothetical protein